MLHSSSVIRWLVFYWSVFVEIFIGKCSRGFTKLMYVFLSGMLLLPFFQVLNDINGIKKLIVSSFPRDLLASC
jgi:hypothetical protein